MAPARKSRHAKSGRQRANGEADNGGESSGHVRTADEANSKDEHNQAEAMNAGLGDSQPGQAQQASFQLRGDVLGGIFTSINPSEDFEKQVMTFIVSNGFLPLVAQFKLDVVGNESFDNSLEKFFRGLPGRSARWPNVDRQTIIAASEKLMLYVLKCASMAAQSGEPEAGMTLAKWANHLYRKNKDGFFSQLLVTKVNKSKPDQRLTMTKEACLAFCARLLLMVCQDLSMGNKGIFEGIFNVLLASPLVKPAQQVVRAELEAMVIIKYPHPHDNFTPKVDWIEEDKHGDLPSWLAGLVGISSTLVKSDTFWNDFDEEEVLLFRQQSEAEHYAFYSGLGFSFAAIAAVFPLRSRQDCIDYFLENAEPRETEFEASRANEASKSNDVNEPDAEADAEVDDDPPTKKRTRKQASGAPEESEDSQTSKKAKIANTKPSDTTTNEPDQYSHANVDSEVSLALQIAQESAEEARKEGGMATPGSASSSEVQSLKAEMKALREIELRLREDMQTAQATAERAESDLQLEIEHNQRLARDIYTLRGYQERNVSLNDRLEGLAKSHGAMHLRLEATEQSLKAEQSAHATLKGSIGNLQQNGNIAAAFKETQLEKRRRLEDAAKIKELEAQLEKQSNYEEVCHTSDRRRKKVIAANTNANDIYAKFQARTKQLEDQVRQLGGTPVAPKEPLPACPHIK
ncbi:uncharacterized protein MYCGRDRAFT_91905 [Zymoseptoria tritici IPO323]|uniref:Uncharacterized protein n=1 Tax=Zymoseptoria tritici (strain CBS 115943 / IPO323) TaxID=336722 RepID=F9X7D6_ZYMTI|nr:uncharacterized protein MYCGRDRAFT_91905 [Zymoseptoria tritici IPO323]EGP88939.1 hypothetical protein MYCGRDRAFT_91905 [Zymoseptoria tritici IPO323]